MLTSALRYESVLARFHRDDEIGIPMSVRERYARELAELRCLTLEKCHARPLGELLLIRKVIDRQQLAKALAEQHRGGHSELLGEILIRRDWASSDAIHNALETQCNQEARLLSSAGSTNSQILDEPVSRNRVHERGARILRALLPVGRKKKREAHKW